MLLKDIAVGQKFKVPGLDDVFMKCDPTNWDQLRSNTDHKLFGVEPQIPRRLDAIYVVKVQPASGVLLAMLPDQPVTLVEELDAEEDVCVEVAIFVDGKITPSTTVFFPKNQFTTSRLKRAIRRLGFTEGFEYGRPIRIAIHDPVDGWLEADGSKCAKQDKPQFRSLEVDVRVGSVRV